MALIDSPDTPQLQEFLPMPSSGMVSNRDAAVLDPAQCVILSNPDLSVEGVRTKSKGYEGMGSPAAFAGNNSSLTGLFNYEVPFHQSGPRCLVGKWDNTIYSSTPDPTIWNRHTGPTFFAPTYYTGCVAGQLLVVCGCVPYASGPSGRQYGRTYMINGPSNWTYTDGLGTGGPPVSDEAIRHVSFNFRHLWMTAEDAIYWRSMSTQSAFSTLTKQFNFLDNDENVATSSLREATPRLLIWRKRSIYLLDIYWANDGFSASDTRDLDFQKAQIRPIVDEVGCIASRGFCWAPGAGAGVGDYFFLAHDGIRSLQRALNDTQGGVGLPLSYRIQPIIDRINWPYADRSCAVYHKGTAYFSVPVDGSHDPNLVIAYDLNRDAFWTTDLKVLAWARATLPSRPLQAYFASGDVSSETYTPGGTVIMRQIYQLEGSAYRGVAKFSGGVFPFPAPYDEISRALTYPTKGTGPSTNNGQDIKKRWDYCEFVMQSGATSATLQVSYRLDDSTSWTALGYLAFPSSTAGTYRRRMSLRSLPPAYKLQFRLQDQTSFAAWKINSWQVFAFPQNQTLQG